MQAFLRIDDGRARDGRISTEVLRVFLPRRLSNRKPQRRAHAPTPFACPTRALFLSSWNDTVDDDCRC